MPIIKKFKFFYNQISQILLLPKNLPLIKKQNKISKKLFCAGEQKNYLDSIINKLNKDPNGTCFVDFDGYQLSELKEYWFLEELSRTSLTNLFYPDYLQYSSTGEYVGRLFYLYHLLDWVSTNQEDTMPIFGLLLNIKHISFVYRDANGNPSEFSLVALPDGNSANIEWIITIVQNFKAKPEERKVTLLISSDFVKIESPTIVNPLDLKSELKHAINNEKIFALIQNIFDRNSFLNVDYISDLNTRIKPFINIDNRNVKATQFDFIFNLSQKCVDADLQEYIANVKNKINEEINFFKGNVYEKYLNHAIHLLALKLAKKFNSRKSVNELENALKNISENVAYLETLAERFCKNIEMSNTFKALIKKINSDAMSIKFDGTEKDDNKIIFLSRMDISCVQRKVEHFYKSNSKITEYNEYKSKFFEKLYKDISELFNPSISSFWDRNFPAMAVSLCFGLVVAITLDIGLSEMVDSLIGRLIAISSGVIAFGIVFSVQCYCTEKEYPDAVSQYFDNVLIIIKKYKHSLTRLEEALQKEINLNSFLALKRYCYIANKRIDDASRQVKLKYLCYNTHRQGKLKHSSLSRRLSQACMLSGRTVID